MKKQMSSATRVVIDNGSRGDDATYSSGSRKSRGDGKVQKANKQGTPVTHTQTNRKKLIMKFVLLAFDSEKGWMNCQ